jgi:hypothetical protein
LVTPDKNDSKHKISAENIRTDTGGDDSPGFISVSIKRKRRDFLHKLSAFYAREYQLIAVEDLDVKEMLESPRKFFFADSKS